jgi:hypothetical protein
VRLTRSKQRTRIQRRAATSCAGPRRRLALGRAGNRLSVRRLRRSIGDLYSRSLIRPWIGPCWSAQRTVPAALYECL